MDNDEEMPTAYYGWWRITETSQWSSSLLDTLGPAVLSLTGYADRLRMHCLLAYVNTKPTKTGVSFTWEGAWEYDQNVWLGPRHAQQRRPPQGVDPNQGRRLQHVRRRTDRGA